MSKYNEQHATTMLNALQGTDTLKQYAEQIRADERAKLIDLIERHLWNYSKEVWVDFLPIWEKLKEQE